MRKLIAEGKKFWILDYYPFTASERNQDKNEALYMVLYMSFLFALLYPARSHLIGLEDDISENKITRRTVLKGLLGFTFLGLSSYGFYEAAVKQPKTIYLTVTNFLRKIINQPEYLTNTQII